MVNTLLLAAIEGLERYFAMAQGKKEIPALEMTK